MSLVFLALYLYMSKRVCLNKKDYYKGVIVYLSSCVLAQAFNIILRNQNVNCYYISPFVPSPLAVFKDIYINFGWFANMILLPLAIIIASAVVYYVGYFIRTRKNKSKEATK